MSNLHDNSFLICSPFPRPASRAGRTRMRTRTRFDSGIPIITKCAEILLYFANTSIMYDYLSGNSQNVTMGFKRPLVQIQSLGPKIRCFRMKTADFLVKTILGWNTGMARLCRGRPSFSFRQSDLLCGAFPSVMRSCPTEVWFLPGPLVLHVLPCRLSPTGRHKACPPSQKPHPASAYSRP